MTFGLVLLVAFLVIFYTVGFGLLWNTALEAWRSTKASNWPTTPASITLLEVGENSDGEGGTTYELKVQYRYTVDGVVYESSRLAFGYRGSSDRDVPQKLLQKLKSARSVSARYSSDNPATSCLSYGLHQSIQFRFAFAITWLLFCVGFTLVAWLSSRPDLVLLNNLSIE